MMSPYEFVKLEKEIGVKLDVHLSGQWRNAG